MDLWEMFCLGNTATVPNQVSCFTMPTIKKTLLCNHSWWFNYLLHCLQPEDYTIRRQDLRDIFFRDFTAPDSFSLRLEAFASFLFKVSAVIMEVLPALADVRSSFGDVSKEGLPRTSFEVTKDCLGMAVSKSRGGALIPSPSDFGRLEIFSRFTTGTNKLEDKTAHIVLRLMSQAIFWTVFHVNSQRK